MYDVKKKLYELLTGDATLQTILGGNAANRRVFFHKKPTTSEEGGKYILYKKIITNSNNLNRKKNEDSYQFVVEAGSGNDCDEIYERLRILLEDYNVQEGNTMIHRMKEDIVYPDELLDDNKTWQLIARYVVKIERLTA